MANSNTVKLLTVYASGGRNVHHWSLPSAYLPDADLVGANLCGADLAEAHLLRHGPDGRGLRWRRFTVPISPKPS